MGSFICPPVLLLLLTSACLSGVQSKVYMIQLHDSPAVQYDGSVTGYGATTPSPGMRIHGSRSAVQNYAEYLGRTHDNLLTSAFPNGDYMKLYSYYFVVNGFAVDFKHKKQADQLAQDPRVKYVEPDSRVRTATTHTPDYLGLPNGAWAENGGVSRAGEDIVIGFVDTGVNPFHPSFANDEAHPYNGPVDSYTGSCEVAEEFPQGSCNYKLIGARHFSAAAEASGAFNATQDFASPLDGDGHGTHTSSTAGGNYGVPVVVGGLNFGMASGIAPRARIAIYKALYRHSGGFLADVVAAIDQAAADGVDILSLSISPEGGPPDLDAVYISIFDVALLGAVKAGVFVTQAAGNGGPFESSIMSFSPWIVTAAAGYTDRNYSNSITLGNGKTLTGFGFANGTAGDVLYTIVLSTQVNVAADPGVPIEDCQSSELFNKTLVEGHLLVCTFTVDFIYGIATVKAVSETAKNLSAAGFILVVPYGLYNFFDLAPPVIVEGLPAIVIASPEATTDFLDYLNSTKTEAQAKLNGGIQAVYSGAAPVVAFFSSRGPDFDDLGLVPNDVLKPNILAPGVKIWAGWSPIGIDESGVFEGENFALVSGTSMATPHVAGIAALVKQKNPSFSPAAIHSALAGTAFNTDKYGAVLQAEYATSYMQPASPFDLGAGHVNATAALDPGLIFEAGFDDYVEFLCHIRTLNSSEVRNATGSGCENVADGYASDLNTPYITIGVLEGSRAVTRTVTNVGTCEECYTLVLDGPADVTSNVTPTSFSVAPGNSQSILLSFQSNTYSNRSTFGALHFYGNAGHSITIPITVSFKRAK